MYVFHHTKEVCSVGGYEEAELKRSQKGVKRFACFLYLNDTPLNHNSYNNLRL